MKSIEIIITPSGSVRVEALDFVGPDCEAATAFLEQALGEVTERHHKAEFYARAKLRQNQQVGQ